MALAADRKEPHRRRRSTASRWVNRFDFLFGHADNSPARRGHQWFAEGRIEHDNKTILVIYECFNLLDCFVQQLSITGDNLLEFRQEVAFAGDAVANTNASAYQPASEIADKVLHAACRCGPTTPN